jgi:signal transduction histidine kinase
MDDVQLKMEESKTLIAALFKDILQKSKSDFDFLPETMRVQFDNQSLTAAIRELIKEKSALTDKIAGQQDKLQAFIAAEIHDTVLSDLLFMLRKLESDAPLDRAESVHLLEGVVTKLRELCAELTPRHLSEWGLIVLLEDLFNKTCMRSGFKGTFIPPSSNLPTVPAEVELQIFRIVQECLNNTEKHSKATASKLTIEVLNNELVVSIHDDGIGYSETQSKHAGAGLSIMTERVSLIRLQLPASLSCDSKPGFGTTVTLKVQLS